MFRKTFRSLSSLNRENIGINGAELVAMWNKANPEDQIVLLEY